MSALLSNSSIQHLIAGLAIIGAVCALAATGTITGVQSLAIIGPVGGLLLGGTLATSAAAQGASAALSTPAPPTAPPVA